MVYISENGREKYSYMLKEVTRTTIEQATEEVLYERSLKDALCESRKDFIEGNYYTSREEMMSAVTKKRSCVVCSKIDG